MKKWLMIFVLVTSSSVYASGIPVVDVASITQMVKDGVVRAKEFQEQMVEARNRLLEMKQQGEHYKQMVEGHYDFEDVLNDPYLNQFIALDDWKEIYDDAQGLEHLRDEFGLYSDDPKVQRRYDSQLRQYQLRQKYYRNSVERNKRMQKLYQEFNGATTPAAKSDIANAISFERMQMQNDDQLMASMDEMMERQQMLERESAARENTRKLFNEGIPRSTSFN
ncbi:TPA: conjugal transfer protein TrbJ [Vibrio cholerae]|uniref:type IV secretion system protein n=2 Tax=Vibrio cholerae TaxID=666 RepID=UPI001A1F7B00|nr:type IV secretion system protein [Vibrio cholerae]HAS6017042.1 conjugal transfer protein TrbJ [Vibrio cholerae O1]ELL8242994.1 conjugal transfer protein TrbJ [Vibrio cholerae]EMA7652473.1 conjugal transfer protein TrbJ [Vibrio cholerae]UIP05448.1 type IV secretion system protein [Vibrio cholerae]HAS4019041.1 conjugal transfer protein TrbJ [Vibrio cholerae]